MSHRSIDGVEQLRNRAHPLDPDTVGGLTSSTAGADYHDPSGLVNLTPNTGNGLGQIGIVDCKNRSYNDWFRFPGSR